MRRLFPLAGAALALTLALPATAADVQLPTDPMSAEDTAAIDAAIEAALEANPEIPAMYIGVWDPERGYYTQAYGLADVANEVPASVDDHFRIGSISKTFMAAVFLQLIDEGLVSLESTVADVDPELAQQFPAYAEISMEQLLGMTSGVEDYMNVPDAAVSTLVLAPDTQWQPEQLIGFGVDAGVKEPGTPGYSTTNYIVLQELAETLTGEAIQELMAKRLTEPLGLTGTALPYNEDTTLPQPQSHGYMSTACIEELIKDGAEPVPVGTDTTDWNASYGQSGGGMHSTIEDLGTWAASMSGSSLLSGELAAKRLDWHDIGAGVFQYGLGISQFSNEVGHEGEAIGWEGWAGHDPETGLTAVVFTNSCADLGEVLKGVDAVDPVFAPYGEMVLSFLEG